MKKLGTAWLATLALVLAACGVPANADGSAGEMGTTTGPTTTTLPGDEPESVDKVEPARTERAQKPKAGFDCPVTIPEKAGFTPTEPDAVYTENFPHPDPFPTEYPGEESVWYGEDGLWTVLPRDGLYDERKTVFWSANFPGGTVEEQPELEVTWTRLDAEEERVVDNDGVATNAYTPEHGWFMITGTDVLEAGCWQVDATYKDATLTYVYSKS